ncbi:MAG: EAL domain-containing protein [Acidobacteria bacterium]|nr:EAL domain-containing protein [Acidobacteriota bacterium]
MSDANARPVLQICGRDEETRARVSAAVRALGETSIESPHAEFPTPLEATVRGFVVATSDVNDVQRWVDSRQGDATAGSVPWLVVATDPAVVEIALAVGANDFISDTADDVGLRQRVRCFLRTCSKIQRPETSVPAHRDRLTGLATRAQFVDHLEATRAQASRRNERFAVLHVDIDRFGAINESLGRSVGDNLLRSVGERLAACLREGDTLARGEAADDVSRFGGDEFMLALPYIDSSLDPSVVASRVTAALREPFDIDDTEIFVTASVGIAVSPDDARTVADLIECGQTAAHHAKNEGGNAYMFYSARMNADAAARLDLATQIHRGLAEDEFELVYQPIYDSEGREIRSVEALLRWQHPQEGLVLPGTFVPVAEETGLILPLGHWVIDKACAQWRDWLDSGVGPVRISVNVSPRQFHDPGFLGKIDDAVELHGVDPGFIQFELTERVFMDGGEAAKATTAALKERGFGLAVDDFGTGYSSLNYLRDFPADVLKIDRSFVAGIPEDQENCSLVAAIVAMAHKLRLSVVAEGVETEAQLRFLRALDCEQIQGFLLGRPVPVPEIEAQLRGSLDGSGRKVIAFRRHAAQ